MKKLYILDASGYLYRAYFAIRNMTNNQGESTNALFGFIRSYQKLIKDFQPEHLVCVFDGPKGGSSRSALFADYKAHRKETPKDLISQIERAKTFCELAGIPTLCVTGVEADDTMASLAQFSKSHETEIYLCTSDKDLCQMVGERVFLLNTHKENLILNRDGVKNQFGVYPEQIIDYLAITGDAADNVPGLSGFGPKTAASLLQEFGTLDALLAHPEKVSGEKKQRVLVEEKEKVLLSRKLVVLDCNVPIPEDTNHYSLKPPLLKELSEFYTEMQFQVFLKDLAHTPSEKHETSYHTVQDQEAFRQLIETLKQQTEIAFSIIPTDPFFLKARICGISFSVKSGEGFYVPLNGSLNEEEVLLSLKNLFESPSIGFYSHNLKFDLHVLENHGISLAHPSFDTMVASYLLNSHSRQHGLDFLSLELLGKGKPPLSDLTGKGKKSICLSEVPVEKISVYCCEDADDTFRLKQLLEKSLKERGLEELLYKLELPLVSILVRMEQKGIFLDTEQLRRSREECCREIAKIENRIYETLEETVNLNSPKQLAVKLIDLGIRLKKTKTGHSTSAEHLEELEASHPILREILEYRVLEKLRSTYFDSLPQEIYPETQRIHCTFNQSVAATGRLSCQNPNLQNIPVRTEMGKGIREAFRPQKEGWVYLSADYSQIELRLLAHFSEDPTLVSAFENNEDIHAHTASVIFNIPLEEVTSEMRYRAKAVNFGIVYGQQSFGLAKQLSISEKEARGFITKYFERYKNVQEFLESCKESARKSGRSVTITKRERLIPEILSTNFMLRQAAERLAINTPLQGSAADMIKQAMITIEQEVKKRSLQGYLILQVHDELIFEIPEKEIDLWIPLVKEGMQNVFSLKVPLIVDLSVGKNWKEC